MTTLYHIFTTRSASLLRRRTSCVSNKLLHVPLDLYWHYFSSFSKFILCLKRGLGKFFFGSKNYFANQANHIEFAVFSMEILRAGRTHLRDVQVPPQLNELYSFPQTFAEISQLISTRDGEDLDSIIKVIFQSTHSDIYFGRIADECSDKIDDIIQSLLRICKDYIPSYPPITWKLRKSLLAIGRSKSIAIKVRNCLSQLEYLPELCLDISVKVIGDVTCFMNRSLLRKVNVGFSNLKSNWVLSHLSPVNTCEILNAINTHLVADMSHIATTTEHERILSNFMINSRIVTVMSWHVLTNNCVEIVPNIYKTLSTFLQFVESVSARLRDEAANALINFEFIFFAMKVARKSLAVYTLVTLFTSITQNGTADVMKDTANDVMSRLLSSAISLLSAIVQLNSSGNDKIANIIYEAKTLVLNFKLCICYVDDIHLLICSLRELHLSHFRDIGNTAADKYLWRSIEAVISATDRMPRKLVAEFLSLPPPITISASNLVPGDWCDLLSVVLTHDLLRGSEDPNSSIPHMCLTLITRARLPLHPGIPDLIDLAVKRVLKRSQSGIQIFSNSSTHEGSNEDLQSLINMQVKVSSMAIMPNQVYQLTDFVKKDPIPHTCEHNKVNFSDLWSMLDFEESSAVTDVCVRCGKCRSTHTVNYYSFLDEFCNQNMDHMLMSFRKSMYLTTGNAGTNQSMNTIASSSIQCVEKATAFMKQVDNSHNYAESIRLIAEKAEACACCIDHTSLESYEGIVFGHETYNRSQGDTHFLPAFLATIIAMKSHFMFLATTTKTLPTFSCDYSLVPLKPLVRLALLPSIRYASKMNYLLYQFLPLVFFFAEEVFSGNTMDALLASNCEKFRQNQVSDDLNIEYFTKVLTWKKVDFQKLYESNNDLRRMYKFRNVCIYQSANVHQLSVSNFIEGTGQAYQLFEYLWRCIEADPSMLTLFPAEVIEAVTFEVILPTLLENNIEIPVGDVNRILEHVDSTKYGSILALCLLAHNLPQQFLVKIFNFVLLSFVNSKLPHVSHIASYSLLVHDPLFPLRLPLQILRKSEFLKFVCFVIARILIPSNISKVKCTMSSLKKVVDKQSNQNNREPSRIDLVNKIPEESFNSMQITLFVRLLLSCVSIDLPLVSLGSKSTTNQLMTSLTGDIQSDNRADNNLYAVTCHNTDVVDSAQVKLDSVTMENLNIVVKTISLMQRLYFKDVLSTLIHFEIASKEMFTLVQNDSIAASLMTLLQKRMQQLVDDVKVATAAINSGSAVSGFAAVGSVMPSGMSSNNVGGGSPRMREISEGRGEESKVYFYSQYESTLTMAVTFLKYILDRQTQSNSENLHSTSRIRSLQRFIGVLFDYIFNGVQYYLTLFHPFAHNYKILIRVIDLFDNVLLKYAPQFALALAEKVQSAKMDSVYGVKKIAEVFRAVHENTDLATLISKATVNFDESGKRRRIVGVDSSLQDPNKLQRNDVGKLFLMNRIRNDAASKLSSEASEIAMHEDKNSLGSSSKMAGKKRQLQ